MIGIIRRLLNKEKYSFIEKPEYIRIHDYIEGTNMEDQETFIQVECENKKYFVYEVNRGVKSLKFESNDKILFLAYVYFYVDRLYLDKSKIHSLDGKIYLLLLDNKVEEAKKLLEENLNPKYASINKIENGKISLIKREKDSAIIFNDMVVEDGIEYTEGFGTLIIRSKYLERFEQLFNTLKESLPVYKYYDELLDFYVFNKKR